MRQSILSALKNRTAAIMVSIAIIATALLAIPQAALAADSGNGPEIVPYSRIDTVIETYRTYICHQNGAHNKDRYDITWKSLYFLNGYTVSAPYVSNSWQVSGECQYNHTGTVYLYHYDYYTY